MLGSSKTGTYKTGHGTIVYQTRALPFPVPLAVGLGKYIQDKYFRLSHVISAYILSIYKKG